MSESRRRQVARRGVLAAGVAGVAWTAPRVDGLSLRPDFAAAQSGPVDSGDAPGTAVFDAAGTVSFAASSFQGVLDAVTPGLPSGVTTASLGAGAVFIPSVGPTSVVAGRIVGPGVGDRCSITGIDATNSTNPGTLHPVTSPGSIFVSRRGPGITWPTTVTVHVVCT